ncbi:hypothetical protein, partial [Falsiroseomonas sp.]|uniref:hypothetical protein n=1 Tax=Falsiroseomonas sp. TaxID=2870721 RepID=UPI00271A16EE
MLTLGLRVCPNDQRDSPPLQLPGEIDKIGFTEAACDADPVHACPAKTKPQVLPGDAAAVNAGRFQLAVSMIYKEDLAEGASVNGLVAEYQGKLCIVIYQLIKPYLG